jgi:hypothetical protein
MELLLAIIYKGILFCELLMISYKVRDRVIVYNKPRARFIVSLEYSL